MTAWRPSDNWEGRTEDGFSLIELIISMGILTIVLTAFAGALVAAQNSLATQESRTQSNDQVRQALFSVDREIRSGILFYDPAGELVPNYDLVVYTQANAPTRTPPNQCVEWRIDTLQQLNIRRWDPADPGGVSAWAPVAEDIVNRLAGVPAFTFDNTQASPVIDVVLLANANYTPGDTDTVRVSSSVAARNYSPSTTCTPRPAG